MAETDLISRQDAIDAVSEACFELRGVFGRCEDALKALPSAHPEQRWIPVSERPPKAYQECLFTVERFHWDGEPVTYKVIQKAYGGETNFIAWMPLPEPAKLERGKK